MSGEPQPLTRCVVCYEDLTLYELAHSPCKHCHVEFCTKCLTTAFEIAQKDDVLEVYCPNPHCKKLLNADSMQIDSATIKLWVEQELRHRKYGVLDKYKNWDAVDIVLFITHQRKQDLDHVRRASAAWEDQLTKLRLQAKADLSDVPLAPTLLMNASTDRIDLRSKFTQKVQRSHSVPNVNVTVKKIQLFYPGSDDDDDLHTDTDFSDFEEEETPNNIAMRPATAGNPTRKRIINAIIDEDEELNDCQYHSPMTQEKFFPHCISCHSSPYDRSSPFINGMFSKRSSDMTMISISNTNSSICMESPPKSAPPAPPSHKTKLSSTFKAIFGSKSVSVDVEKKKKTRLSTPVTRPRGHSTSAVAHGNRILDIFTKHRNKRKKSVKKTVSSRQLPSNTKHIKSHTLTLEEIRSITPDPSPHKFPRPRSKSQLAPISPALLQENRLSLSYQKQLMIYNIKNKKKKNTSLLSPPSLVTLKSKSAPMDPPAMNRLAINTTLSPKTITQLKPPSGENTPSMSRSHTASSVSEIDPDLEPPKVLPALQNSYSQTASNINKLNLAPIHSAKELDEQLSIIITPKYNEDQTPIEDIDDVDDMNNFDINAHLEIEMDADDEDPDDMENTHKQSLSSVKIYSSTEDDDDDEDRNTNTNTMPMPTPASPEILPHQSDDDELPPINMGLLQDVSTIDTNTSTQNKDEPETPQTPPTPESPNSGSISNHSHYERAMRNIDAIIAKQTETEPMQQSETHSNDVNNDNNNNKNEPPPPESSGGCNGCLTCIVL